jgi:integrase
MQARHEYTRAVSANINSRIPLSTHPKPEPATVLDAEGRYCTITQAIDLWLQSKYAITQSRCTIMAYKEIITSLHLFLLEQGLDLDRPATEIVIYIQSWASLRSDARKHRGGVSPSTYNQRIAAISSFYQWAIEKGLYQGSNPAKQLSRVHVQKYSESRAQNPQQIAMKLRDIDRTTPRGLRDYTLLQVALNTGRSLQELASLSWGCLHIENGIVTLTIQHCRGGKTLYDRLDIRLSKALLVYLRTIYGEQLDKLEPQAPIWVSFSDRNYNQGIGPQTIADICKNRLGFSTVRSLRHTFAIAMEQQGAGASIIQERLGNASATETDRYLARLRKSL